MSNLQDVPENRRCGAKTRAGRRRVTMASIVDPVCGVEFEKTEKANRRSSGRPTTSVRSRANASWMRRTQRSTSETSLVRGTDPGRMMRRGARRCPDSGSRAAGLAMCRCHRVVNTPWGIASRRRRTAFPNLTSKQIPVPKTRKPYCMRDDHRPAAPPRQPRCSPPINGQTRARPQRD